MPRNLSPTRPASFATAPPAPPAPAGSFALAERLDGAPTTPASLRPREFMGWLHRRRTGAAPPTDAGDDAPAPPTRGAALGTSDLRPPSRVGPPAPSRRPSLPAQAASPEPPRAPRPAPTGGPDGRDEVLVGYLDSGAAQQRSAAGPVDILEMLSMAVPSYAADEQEQEGFDALREDNSADSPATLLSLRELVQSVDIRRHVPAGPAATFRPPNRSRSDAEVAALDLGDPEEWVGLRARWPVVLNSLAYSEAGAARNVLAAGPKMPDYATLAPTALSPAEAAEAQCPLSLEPLDALEQPLAVRSGRAVHVFEFSWLMRHWARPRHQTNPVNRQPLAANDMLRVVPEAEAAGQAGANARYAGSTAG